MSDVTVTTDQEDVSTEKTGVRPTVQRRPSRPDSPNGTAVTPPSARNGQSVPRERIVVSPQRPVLQVPIQLDLGWPIFAQETDREEQLFFSFRRF